MRSLYIDISDLLVYAVHNKSVTGIQRVEISFLQHMISHNLPFRLVDAFGLSSARLEAIIRSEIYVPDNLLRKLRQECAALQLKNRYTARNKLQRMIRNFFARFHPEGQIEAGDTLFIPGAFWADLDIMEFYRRLTAKGVKLVVLLHDVLPLTHQQFMVKHSERFFGPILTLPIHVLTGAKSTERDIPQAVSLFKGARDPLSVEVIPFAHEFPGTMRNEPAGTKTERLVQLIGGRPFVLCVGTVEVRKNHLQLFKVWNKLARDNGSAMPLLLIAGKRGWEAEEAIAFLDAANGRQAAGGSEEAILFVEAPTDLELKWLYSSCLFTVFPSFAEGWGLPVGESLWFGKACAASQSTSVPEVGGDLCLYYDPNAPEEMETAIKALLDPATRASYELKIRATHLRTWQEAAHDLVSAVLAYVPRVTEV